MTLMARISGFFKPNPLAFLGLHIPLPVDAAGYYFTHPLQATLSDFVDFPSIHGGPAGSPSARRSFKPAKCAISIAATRSSRFVMSWLPPAFPAVRIDGDIHIACKHFCDRDLCHAVFSCREPPRLL
jgi:NTE family protein